MSLEATVPESAPHAGEVMPAQLLRVADVLAARRRLLLLDVPRGFAALPTVGSHESGSPGLVEGVQLCKSHMFKGTGEPKGKDPGAY